MTQDKTTNEYLGTMPEGACQNYGGKIFWPMNPQPEDFDLETVAHSLSLKTRWNGQCNEFYSVAQHCCLVAAIVEPELKLQALFHELDEVFLPDIPRPLKPLISDWKPLAKRHHEAGCQAFGLLTQLPDEVHEADNIALATEARDLMDTDAREKWGFDVDPLPTPITPVGPGVAKQMFLDAYWYITNGE